MHSQHLRPELYRFPFRYGLALAESQSRFYENIIGRSRAYWNRYYGDLQKAVPEFADVSPETWYRAINAVHPSLIRVEADEITYGLHVTLRFEIEDAVINGRLKVEDLPGAWNDAMQTYLGVTPDSDANAVLQAIPDATEKVRRGNLGEISRWMADTIQGEGGKFTFAEMAEHATGAEFSSEPYLRYLIEKYNEIYHLA